MSAPDRIDPLADTQPGTVAEPTFELVTSFGTPWDELTEEERALIRSERPGVLESTFTHSKWRRK